MHFFFPCCKDSPKMQYHSGVAVAHWERNGRDVWLTYFLWVIISMPVCVCVCGIVPCVSGLAEHWPRVTHTRGFLFLCACVSLCVSAQPSEEMNVSEEQIDGHPGKAKVAGHHRFDCTKAVLSLT